MNEDVTIALAFLTLGIVIGWVYAEILSERARQWAMRQLHTDHRVDEDYADAVEVPILFDRPSPPTIDEMIYPANTPTGRQQRVDAVADAKTRTA